MNHHRSKVWWNRLRDEAMMDEAIASAGMAIDADRRKEVINESTPLTWAEIRAIREFCLTGSPQPDGERFHHEPTRAELAGLIASIERMAKALWLIGRLCESPMSIRAIANTALPDHKGKADER